ncbi:uncharacterized protein MYCFIDRAFT_75470 [Pseudocercospora fijiensis CIRAD86]|uniref:Uncharacterized protein n=1 Tax=Pseudocercospora fijiensis (strain CIRAD86) TaxID=383855 RepID=N1Q638_PSEFD|nr:uncharacterized protein MYCFIDRAFT_75470 [Pseudocercospora fijiensis CIRAD86]EME87624.1 hypothetical protein MYCFIDRAFT_75470 [Pseudocercospora fijiensis CIRAD86]
MCAAVSGFNIVQCLFWQPRSVRTRRSIHVVRAATTSSAPTLGAINNTTGASTVSQHVSSVQPARRRSATKYSEVQIYSPREAGRFARLVEEQVSAHPNDPLIIAVNGYQEWLGDVLHSCLEDNWQEIAELDRAVQFASTIHMNVPQVYYWSVDMEPPHWEEKGLPPMDTFKFRTGVWFCGRGACRLDRKVSVTLVFTRPTPVSEHIVTRLLFDYLWRDNDFDQAREDEEGICWTFSRLYYLLTDWQNIIGEVLARLDEAEINSHGRRLPVKIRTRRMHAEVDRIYEMKEYLHFHTRSFKKLQKLKDDVPQNEQKDPLWFDMDDAVDDLEQFDSTLDGLTERLNNLIELEFNITNATQSDNSAFLTVVATIFLPISFLSSLFGMSTVTWPVIWYVYAAIPIFVTSVAFAVIFPWARKRVLIALDPIEERRLMLQPNQFTLLGEDYPGNVNAPENTNTPGGSNRQGRFKHQAKGVSRSQSRPPSRPRKRSRLRFGGEKRW